MFQLLRIYIQKNLGLRQIGINLPVSGFTVTDVDIKLYSKKDLENTLSNKDIIFVAGGTTTYLLQQAVKSGFDRIVKKLINNGIIYIGSEQDLSCRAKYRGRYCF